MPRYGDPGVYTIQLTAQDPGGGLVSATSTATIGDVAEGSTENFELITLADANPLATNQKAVLRRGANMPVVRRSDRKAR